MRHARLAALWAGAFVSALALPLSAATATPSGSVASASTDVRAVSPMDSQDHVAAGFRISHRYGDANCESGSPTVGKAYQCFTPQSPQGIFDSCWIQSDKSFVVCLVKPWLHKVERLHVTRGYGDSAGFLTVHRPWGVRLRTGPRCLVILGAVHSTRGQRIDYDCNHRIVLAGPIRHHGTTWHARAYRKVHHGGHRITYTSLGSQPLSVAWSGKPSQKN
jgi:hypothetical protein